MASKRATTKFGGPPGAAAGSAGLGPLATAGLLVGAVGYGLWVLVDRGRLSWPPTQLLASLYTVAGGLALVGPLVLSRGPAGGGERGLGDLLWMTGGSLVWVFDAVAVLKGDYRVTAWATPLGQQTMGMTMLAVMFAGWRCRQAGRGWSWTNVTGWVLGLFWVGLAVAAVWPGRVGSLAWR